MTTTRKAVALTIAVAMAALPAACVEPLPRDRSAEANQLEDELRGMGGVTDVYAVYSNTKKIGSYLRFTVGLEESATPEDMAAIAAHVRGARESKDLERFGPGLEFVPGRDSRFHSTFSTFTYWMSDQGPDQGPLARCWRAVSRLDPAVVAEREQISRRFDSSIKVFEEPGERADTPAMDAVRTCLVHGPLPDSTALSVALGGPNLIVSGPTPDLGRVEHLYRALSGPGLPYRVVSLSIEEGRLSEVKVDPLPDSPLPDGEAVLQEVRRLDAGALVTVVDHEPGKSDAERSPSPETPVVTVTAPGYDP